MATAQQINCDAPGDLPDWPAIELNHILDDPEDVFRQFRTFCFADQDDVDYGMTVRSRGPGVFETTIVSPSIVGRQLVCQLATDLGMVASAYTKVPALRNQLRGDCLVLIQLPLVDTAVHDHGVPWPDTTAAISYLAPGSMLPVNLTRAGPRQTMALFGTLDGFHRKWHLGREIASALGYASSTLQQTQQLLRRPWSITRGAVEMIHDVFDCKLRDQVARSYFEARSHQLLCECLGALADDAAAPSMPTRTRRLIQRARDLIINDLAEKHTLRSLAHAVGLNRTLLAEAFHVEFGQTVFKFMQYQRLKRAWTLIETSRDSVGSVAAQVGYRDTSSFSRAFKARFGISPRQVRDRQTQSSFDSARR